MTLDGTTIEEGAAADSAGTCKDGRSWPTRPALLAACAIAAGGALAAWLVRAAGVSGEAVSTVLYGAGFLAAVLAVGVVLLLLVGTVEVMFKRRASRESRFWRRRSRRSSASGGWS